MTSAFLLYKNAKKLYDEEKIVLLEEKDNTFYFDCNSHNTKLCLIKNSHWWERVWTCDCTANALRPNVECVHVKGAELFLMMGGYNGKNKTRCE